MRKRSRVIAIVSVAAVLSAVAATFALTAKADPDLFAEGENGRVTEKFFDPDNSQCGVEVAVDLHLGYPNGIDEPASHRSGVVRVTRLGTQTLRAQVNFVRVGADDASPVRTDQRPSKSADVRDNGLTPADPLNSDTDYPGNVKNVVAHTDWLPNVDDDPTIPGIQAENFRVRGNVSFRCTDGDVFARTKLSASTSNDAA